jgi:hypothetical protein
MSDGIFTSSVLLGHRSVDVSARPASNACEKMEPPIEEDTEHHERQRFQPPKKAMNKASKVNKFAAAGLFNNGGHEPGVRGESSHRATVMTKRRRSRQCLGKLE